jgi:predicted RNA-binding Zn ribbon-like protein
MATESGIGEMKLVGGELCLDFANTVGGRLRANDRKIPGRQTVSILRDKLGDYGDLVVWGRHTGVLTAKAAQHLLQKSESEIKVAVSVFERGIVLREAIYHIFKAIADKRRPAPPHLETLNKELSIARSHERLVWMNDHFALQWDDREEALDSILWPVARSAADFLISSDLSRVKECGGEKCGWLFVDTSKNHSRQWCVMEDCGNLAKIRRFRLRQREVR